MKAQIQFIKQVARKIGKKFQPQKIILFGSYSKGCPNPQSDVDLLVIFADKKKLSQRYIEISKEIEPRLFPVDLLIRSSKDIQRRLKMGDSFIEEVIRKGKVLYES